MSVHVREIEKEIGAETVKLIHDEAEKGGISIKTAEQLAAELGRKGEKVIGNSHGERHRWSGGEADALRLVEPRGRMQRERTKADDNESTGPSGIAGSFLQAV